MCEALAMGRGGAWVFMAGAALGVCLEALAEWLLRRRREVRVREVLFFPSRVTCVEGLLAAAREDGGKGLRLAPCLCSLPHEESELSRLLARLLSARRSLELCIFAFSCPQLSCAILLLQRRGVRVRVVTDADYMAVKGSQIGILRKAGIQVRHDQESGYMHHKFAIIDKRLLLTGSLNWTTQAIQHNRENVMIVEDAKYVKLFLEEFERLWEDYNPVNYIFFKEKEVPKETNNNPGTERKFNK
ncbi:mitochondrial cardiolipin hydrolase [Eublepharis macularius]|uniref:Mitochondrial cardiolipin hydrolase n=1 Tax=Eublepharis macularius TaxID=481883 RepID=A0AA97K6Y6_EUBMA|nr:mitochondrial cardiolipin hydrolase [Eublepharis macularius]